MSFSLHTERVPEGIRCFWPNGEVMGMIAAKVFQGGLILWHCHPEETGMPDWSFHSQQAAEFYMLSAAHEYIDSTEDKNKLEKKELKAG